MGFRKGLQLAFMIGLLVPSLILAPVSAVGNDNGDGDTSVSSDASDKVKTTLEERLAERKAKIQAKLDRAQETRLKGRCRAAQVILKSYGERLGRLDERRTAAHDTVVAKLNDIVTRVGDQADTTELKTSIETLQDKIDDFETTLDEYRQAVDDLAAMECTEDPEAFKATLETVRTQRKDLLADAKDIRKFVIETIKPQLKELRTELAGTNGAEPAEAEEAE